MNSLIGAPELLLFLWCFVISALLYAVGGAIVDAILQYRKDKLHSKDQLDL